MNPVEAAVAAMRNGTTTRPDGAGPPSGPLAELVDVYRRWLHLPDVGAVYTAVGTVAANLLPGDPVWTLIVGPPSSGKTEAINPIASLPYVHPVSVVTPAALLSGTSAKQREQGATGGVLRAIGDDRLGILFMKDFTSVLEQHRDARGEALAALREVYDGHYDRALGTGGGRVLSWRGKCGLIGAVTPAIDRHHAVMATMGERVILYRLSVADPAEQARRRLRNRSAESAMRDDMARVLVDLFDRFDPAAPPPPRSNIEDEWLVRLAVFTVNARTGVDRDGYSREVELMPTIEAPARFAGQLAQLWTGMLAVGVSRPDSYEVVGRIAWDSVPEMRRRVLQTLHAVGPSLQSTITQRTDIPSTSCQRTLEDLRLLGLVDGERQPGTGTTAAWLWSLSDQAARMWPDASPEKSGTTHTQYSASRVLEDFSGEAHRGTAPE